MPSGVRPATRTGNTTVAVETPFGAPLQLRVACAPSDGWDTVRAPLGQGQG